MTIILADLSKYDPDEVADDYAGVILNIEDPGLLHKAEIAWAAGKVIFLYSWVYAGDHGHSLTRGYAAEDLLAFHGIAVTGHLTWLDYEEDGVTVNDLRNVKQWIDPARPPAVYTYLYMLNAQPGLRDVIAEIGVLWIAYYPGGAEYGEWMSETARRNGAVMHQYTSSDGHRDLNAVLDEGWYFSLVNAAAKPPEEQPGEVIDMLYHIRDDKTDTWARDAAGILVPLGDLTGAYYEGVRSGQIPVIDYNPLQAIGHNVQTLEAQDKAHAAYEAHLAAKH